MQNEKNSGPAGKLPLLPKDKLKQNLVDCCDLQELFGVSRSTVYNWCKKGMITARKMGRRSLFYLNEIQEILEKHKQVAGPEEEKRK